MLKTDTIKEMKDIYIVQHLMDTDLQKVLNTQVNLNLNSYNTF